jgi:hypothetical protein
MRNRHWVIDPRAARARPTDSEKLAIIAACDKFINEVLKPRFLPEIVPTDFNYPIDICGKWHGGRYRFIQRFRSDGHHTLNGEFEASFARLDYVGRGLFDVVWHRHTARWFRLYRALPLTEALRCIERDGHLHPV